MLRFFNLIVTLCLCAGLFSACTSAKRLYQTSPEVQTLIKTQTIYPEAKFIVFSDPHYFDPALGTSGKAFQAVLDTDWKMLAESSELMEAMIKKIENQEADFVIISGDLTKDGEKRNHQAVAENLAKVVKLGKAVFVIPGDHDVLNGMSNAFEGDQTRTVENVTPDEFAEIYEDYGYAASLARDSDTLSYLAEPVPGLYLLALDGSRWKSNEPGNRSISGAVFSEQTLQWIEKSLIRAKREKKSVIVAIHHGVLEHYPANNEYFAQYLVEDHVNFAELLASYGVKLVFSGHFHAQDITRKRFEKSRKVIYDIETGSLVTSPCPYRIVELTFDQKAVIQSRFIDAIPSHPTDFVSYRDQNLYAGTIKLADAKLKKYMVSEKDRQLLNPQVAKAYATHLRGDEIRPETALEKDGLGLWARIILGIQGDLIEGWYIDLPSADNHITVDLSDGEYTNN
ncbi:MAG: metallophosphoesterase [SAR324 cluster bacterium]|nr:metallophosphoesterase [SAR324 cluster bacterium]